MYWKNNNAEIAAGGIIGILLNNISNIEIDNYIIRWSILGKIIGFS